MLSVYKYVTSEEFPLKDGSNQINPNLRMLYTQIW